MSIDEIIESYEMRACLEEKMGDISNAEEHKQVAEWLRELKRYRDIISYEIEMTDQNNKTERVYVECLKDIYSTLPA